MPKVSKQDKERVKSLLLEKNSLRQIEKVTKIPKTTCSRIAKELNLKPGGQDGRKKKLTPRNVTFCISQLTTGKSQTADNCRKILENEQGVKVSLQTVSRALHLSGLRSGTKKKKPAISEKNRKERLAFAKSHKDWTVADWKTVIFSDETKINRFGSDGRKWTWYR